MVCIGLQQLHSQLSQQNYILTLCVIEPSADNGGASETDCGVLECTERSGHDVNKAATPAGQYTEHPGHVVK